MDMNVLQLVLTAGVGIVGVAVGYGGVKVQVRRNTHDISGLRKDMNQVTGNPSGEPVFMRRTECVAHGAQITVMEKKLTALMSFARHVLTTDKKMTLQQVNEILGED